MSGARLDELRSLGVPIVLAALPASRKRFERCPDAALVHLGLLAPEAAQAFLSARLTQLGLSNGCLDRAAWTQLIAHGHGVPRLLVMLLGFSLFVAGQEHSDRVTGAHVEQAVEARGTEQQAVEVRGTEQQAVEVRGTEPATVEAAESASPEPDGARPPGSIAIPARNVRVPTDARFDWAGVPPASRWRHRAAATAAVTVYLVAAAALLTWGVHRELDRSMQPGSDAPHEIQATPPTDNSAVQVGRDGAAPSGPSAAGGDLSAAATSVIPKLPPVTAAAGAQTPPRSAEELSAAQTPPRSAEELPAAQAATTEPDTVAVAVKPFSEAEFPPAATDDLPHPCGDGEWTWSTCPARPRRVSSPRVRRDCFITLGNLCLGKSDDRGR